MRGKELRLIAFTFILVCVSFFFSKPPAICEKQGEEPIEIVARRSFTGADVVIAIDQSGSMEGYSGFPGTDPNHVRVHASRYFVENLASKSSEGFLQRVGVLYFGDDARQVFPLTPLQSPESPQVQSLCSQINAEASRRYTTFTQAFALAQAMFIQAESIGDNRGKTMVLFTDGKPEEPSGLSEADAFSEIRRIYEEELKPLGVEVFVVGIDNPQNPAFSQTMGTWQSIVGSERVIRIESMSDLISQYFQIIRSIFKVPTQGYLTVDTAVSGGQAEFQVKPYMQALELHIFPQSEEIRFTIQYPDGKEASPEDPGVRLFDLRDYKQMIFEEPQPGFWKVRITQGYGKIIVYPNEIPVTLGLVEPASRYPLGKPLYVKAKLIRNDGRDIKEHPEAPLRMTAIVKYPSGRTEDVLLTNPTASIAVASFSLDLNEEGVYMLNLSASGGQDVRFQDSFQFEVLPIPYIEINEPKEGSSIKYCDKVGIRAVIKVAGETADPSELFKGSPNELVLGQLEDSATGSSKTFWLDYSQEGGEGVFVAQVQMDLHHDSTLLLSTRLKGYMVSDGSYLEQDAQVYFLVRRSGWQKLSRFLLLSLIALASLLFAALIAAAVFLATRPKMVGSLSVDWGYGGQTQRLSDTPLGSRRYRLIITRKPSGPKGKRGVFLVWGAEKRQVRKACVVYLPRPFRIKRMTEGDEGNLAGFSLSKN
jgi:hypothetical protein